MTLVLLGLGVGGAVLRPRRIAAWVPPLVALAAAAAVGLVSADDARASLEPLWSPLLFVAVVVPLAVSLDRLGFFTAAARVATRSPHPPLALWLLTAATVALLNLDAAVVLLTPLFVRVARRTGGDPVAMALPPVLLACLASSFLPVSNLTNLIAQSRFEVGAGDFLANLGLPGVVAVTVGWFAYRRAYSVPIEMDPIDAGAGTPSNAAADRAALRVGAIALSALVLGLVVAAVVDAPPWTAAAVVLLGLAARNRDLPWRSVPVGTIVLAIALAVLAHAAFAQIAVSDLLDGSGVLHTGGVVAGSALAANLFDNLPAFLVAANALPHHLTPTTWAVLLGVNAGPVILVTGSLASLLWIDALRRSSVEVSWLDYARAGIRVGVPALAAATATLMLLTALR